MRTLDPPPPRLQAAQVLKRSGPGAFQSGIWDMWHVSKRVTGVSE